MYEVEGIFHVSCSDQRLYELEVHLGLKNYAILDDMIETPQVVANFLKKLLQEMTEPLIPFKNYPDFRDLPPPKE